MSLFAGPQRFFIPDWVKSDHHLAYRYRLLLNASIGTSFFSLLYLTVSIIIGFPEGISFMIFNVTGFLMLPFLMKTRLSIIILGNVYVFIGALAIVILIYFSGGMNSPIFPWLIASPVMSLLIINRIYSLMWTGISLCCLIGFTIATNTGYVFPENYNQDWHLFFVFLCSSGIILIVMMIEMIFEKSTVNALLNEEARRTELENWKEELAKRHEEIVEKNKLLTLQQEELLTSSRLLTELNKKKDDLMYILAHDLKSPLATTKALVQVAIGENKSIGLTAHEVLKMIGEMTDKSQNLIQKILNAENFENLAYNLKFEKTNVSIILQQVIDDMKTVAADKSIKIQLQKDESKEYCTLCDKIYLSQVYENLINNALKFSPAGKQISVCIKEVGHIIRTEIRDEGKGIKSDEMPMLFRKWQKLSNQPTAGESSTGLGLSIVKQYVELLNGKVWCESSVGHGANFIVELPIH